MNEYLRKRLRGLQLTHVKRAGRLRSVLKKSCGSRHVIHKFSRRGM